MNIYMNGLFFSLIKSWYLKSIVIWKDDISVVVLFFEIGRDNICVFDKGCYKFISWFMIEFFWLIDLLDDFVFYNSNLIWNSYSFFLVVGYINGCNFYFVLDFLNGLMYI